MHELPVQRMLQIKAMKKSKKVAFCAILAALSTVIVLIGQFFTAAAQAMPAIAGLFSIIIVIEIGVKWALAAYFVSSILTFIFGLSEAGLIFVMFFGYYPILKSLLEKIHSRVAEYIAKFAVFNVAMIAAYAILIKIFGLAALGFDSMIFVWIVLAIGNVFFIFYDLCLTKIIALYFQKYHKHIKKLLK